jgi:amidohydrolase
MPFISALAGGLTLCVSSAAAQSFDKDVSALVDKVAAQAIAIRQDIHQHPELSNREVRTAELVATHLRVLGLKVTTGIAKTGVVGVLQGKGPGPVIAVRADMDALPVTEAGDLPFKSTARATHAGREVGVSHACGHDIHVAAALGAASVLASLRDRFNGTVMFVFQPAEEGPPAGEKGGAGLMVEEGIFKELKPDAIVALHTNGDPPDEAGDYERLGQLSYTPGPTFAASTKWTAVVRGRSAHGASPHLSVDPVVTASQIVLALQTLRSRILPPLSATSSPSASSAAATATTSSRPRCTSRARSARSRQRRWTRSSSACATSSTGRRRPRTRPSSCRSTARIR